jgi:hypothetical protein
MVGLGVVMLSEIFRNFAADLQKHRTLWRTDYQPITDGLGRGQIIGSKHSGQYEES